MPVRKKRSESFFGLHFDFHASPDTCPEPIGENLKEEDIREICTLLRPDFIQIDCKGHPGWASYPTECGNAMPEFRGDPLAMWRRVTAEEGVALYLHYSGVIDNKYCAENPEEAVLQADGTRSKESTRTNGRYADDLLIPQICETAGKYGVDGCWIDGDCWGTKTDYDPRTVEAFEKETGISLNGRLPVERDDPYFEEYRDYCRELYRKYVRHVTDTVHSRYPGFQVASNWAFTDHMPEAVTADVDFLSGDFSPFNSLNSARYAGRAIASQNRTWDLMSWNFRINPLFTKHPVQIMQEAASVISLGGGFQNYIQQHRDGSPNMQQIRRMKPLEEFLRERQPYCFRGRIRHQAAMLMSTYDRHHESSYLFSRDGMERLMGLTVLICDCGHSMEIVSEHTLEGHYSDYPLLVIPELFTGLEDRTAESLREYVKNGGKLLLVGQNTCSFFAGKGFGFVTGEMTWQKKATVDGTDFGEAFNCRPVNGKGETVAYVSEEDGRDAAPLAALFGLGKGTVAAIGSDIGKEYIQRTQYIHTDIMKAVLERLYTPVVSVEHCDGKLETVLLEKDGRLMIQLLNVNGDHASAGSVTEKSILPCRDIVLKLRTGKKPEALVLQPRGSEIPFVWKDDAASLSIDRVDIHSVIEVRG